jgi:hypothetical protein
MVKLALVAVSPLVSRTYPVIVYWAPGNKTAFNEIDGPPVPEELVLVSRL